MGVLFDLNYWCYYYKQFGLLYSISYINIIEREREHMWPVINGFLPLSLARLSLIETPKLSIGFLISFLLLFIFLSHYLRREIKFLVGEELQFDKALRWWKARYTIKQYIRKEKHISFVKVKTTFMFFEWVEIYYYYKETIKVWNQL